MSIITPLPTPPSRADSSTFAARGDAFLGALPTFATETNTVASEVNTNASNAATSASNAATSAGTATTQAGLADTARIAAQAAQAAAEAAVVLIPEGSINDTLTTLTDTWSSTKISTELTAKLNATSGSASGITLNDGYTEEVYAVTGTTPALSPTNGSIQTWTLSGASTPTYGTWAEGQSVILMVTAGANTITWPTTIWSKVGGGGAAPSLTASGATCVILWKVGSTTYGALLGSV